MKNPLLFRLLVIGFIIFGVAGFSKSPQEKLNFANAAIEAAKQAEADRYMADKYNAMMDSLNKANEIIKAEQARLSTIY
ncbi:hypothetical protein JW960_00980 [candidate division KSB1 bacterium]|nr:hypothetical protein [candidate division KSB1 bacterium]